MISHPTNSAQARASVQPGNEMHELTQVEIDCVAGGKLETHMGFGSNKTPPFKPPPPPPPPV